MLAISSYTRAVSVFIDSLTFGRELQFNAGSKGLKYYSLLCRRIARDDWPYKEYIFPRLESKPNRALQ